MASRSHDMLFTMINAGELTVGEAREELADARFLPADAVALLAGWLLDRADQGDSWRAGDPETLPCGCRVSYDRTQAEKNCASADCLLDKCLVEV